VVQNRDCAFGSSGNVTEARSLLPFAGTATTIFLRECADGSILPCSQSEGEECTTFDRS